MNEIPQPLKEKFEALLKNAHWSDVVANTNFLNDLMYAAYNLDREKQARYERALKRIRAIDYEPLSSEIAKEAFYDEKPTP